MVLRVYNTATGEKEAFRPLGDSVRMYVCGPTVYDHSHLGHAKAYVTADVVRRYLEFRGYDVVKVLNFTDIEDAITKRAQEEGVDPLDLAERYIAAFHEDMGRLKVRPAHHYPRVTEHVTEIIEAIQQLVEKGHAYVVDGEVYMGTDDDSFGRLSGRPPAEMAVDDLPAGAKRRRPLDFALWKAPQEGEPSWDSPWGRGRPGWHVECFAMAGKYLGVPFDIHTGGRDLIFPHHESEALIAEALGQETFARYWLHNGFMTVGEKRMAKSLGNFVTIRETLQDVDWEVLRFFLLKTHYRENSDFTVEALREAEAEHGEIAAAIARVKEAMEGTPEGEDTDLLEAAAEARTGFLAAMDDDLRTERATGVVLDLARRVNARERLAAATAGKLFLEFCDFCEVLGLCEEAFQEAEGPRSEDARQPGR